MKKPVTSENGHTHTHTTAQKQIMSYNKAKSSLNTSTIIQHIIIYKVGGFEVQTDQFSNNPTKQLTTHTKRVEMQAYM